MSEKFQGQRIFTQQAENKFWDEVSLQTNKDLRNLGNDNEKIIEYLNEKRNTITLGFALKRYICENFSIDFDEKENKYLCTVKFEDNEIMEFSLDNFEIEDCSIDEYANLMMAIGKKNFIPVRKADAKRWLKAKDCIRSTFFEKLSFILEMKPEHVQNFLNRILNENGYNLKNPEEIIYYFCHKNNFKINKAEELIEKYEAVKINNEYKCECKHTNILKNEIKEINGETQLLEYLKNNKISLENISTSIKKEFTNLIYDIKNLLSFIYPQSNINNDFLERIMLEGIPRETKGQDVGENTASEFVSVKDSDLKKILGNILKRDKIDKKLSGEAEAIRKDLIFLRFYKFTLLIGGYEEIINSDEFGEESKELSEEHEKNPVQSMLYFRKITDTMLLNNGMGELYIPNKFDNFILLSLCFKKPYEYFSDVIESSFSTEKTGK